ncbi:hypothetical protein DSO57_1028855 [Entomophthora muscae]|uniref:Uncharacterized protein n=1 Tax=Entomophthora muscae TaxID=34485 RepID=A0ACC2UBP0_9FUNG|nr:hypothetical protein DSO57_1028855 [Entomophthora muscae]
MSLFDILRLRIRFIYIVPLIAALMYLKNSSDDQGIRNDMLFRKGFPNKKSLATDDVANAVILILCRNSDLDGMRRTLRQFEDRFNRKFNYPYLFLNDEEFDLSFRKGVEYEASSRVTFATVPEEDWNMPSWINSTLAGIKMKEMAGNGVPYAETVSYHNMCRYQSGKIFSHPALAEYDYYWRIEPDTHFYCDVNYDPIKWMAENNKVYGFTIALKEVEKSVPSLIRHTFDFMRNYSKPLETDFFPFFP